LNPKIVKAYWSGTDFVMKLVMENILFFRTTLVVGSAAMAFEEVCPDKVELIHKNYR
jgi:hypothetical protein